MALSWEIFLKSGGNRSGGLFPKHWKEDMIRGWQAVQTRSASAVDRSFAEAERIRIRYRLEKTNRKLVEAHQTLGKRVHDHWSGKGNLTEEERKREFRRIGLLLEEQKILLDQMKEMDQPSDPDEKVSP
ncbi:MAG: hypothetical protein MPW14_01985 [Candidatus Manganitrophus sp.]|nr:MAG: hypothetical protein MPW14_01985 [Candidatus Manganitrophus sp.]